MRYFVKDIGKLSLHVYTIGYPEKGESQVIFLVDQEEDCTILSFVIDCYTHVNTNITVDLLAEYSIKRLDYFIWTHTDEDHSMGIGALIDGYCNASTQFFLPEMVAGNENDFINYNQEVKECFEKINAFNTGQNYCVHSISAIPGGHHSILKRTYSDQFSKDLVFEVLGVAPMSAIIRRRWDQGEVKKKNDLSIATIFKVGELSLFFCGDIENQTINHIPDHYLEGLTYVKTPHHTSKSSSKMVEKLEKVLDGNKLPSAVTTTYKVHNLPDEDILKLYKKNSVCVSSTGHGEHDHGYIKSVFDILNLDLSESLHGNAHTF